MGMAIFMAKDNAVEHFTVVNDDSGFWMQTNSPTSFRDRDMQLMVFCGWADGPTNTPALMEFPHVCEIKVNGRVLEAVSTDDRCCRSS